VVAASEYEAVAQGPLVYFAPQSFANYQASDA